MLALSMNCCADQKKKKKNELATDEIWNFAKGVPPEEGR